MKELYFNTENWSDIKDNSNDELKNETLIALTKLLCTDMDFQVQDLGIQTETHIWFRRSS
jgi:hypothetical protein